MKNIEQIRLTKVNERIEKIKTRILSGQITTKTIDSKNPLNIGDLVMAMPMGKTGKTKNPYGQTCAGWIGVYTGQYTRTKIRVETYAPNKEYFIVSKTYFRKIME